jgi:hypothetical protein
MRASTCPFFHGVALGDIQFYYFATDVGTHLHFNFGVHFSTCIYRFGDRSHCNGFGAHLYAFFFAATHDNKQYDHYAKRCDDPPDSLFLHISRLARFLFSQLRFAVHLLLRRTLVRSERDQQGTNS